MSRLTITKFEILQAFTLTSSVSKIWDLRWAAFNDRSESVFLLCMTEVHGCFKPAVETMTRCQECVMEKDNESLLYQLMKLKTLTDQLSHIFHKICVNPRAGENYANPVEWGQRYAKFGAPLSSRVPTLSGLHLPIFHVSTLCMSLIFRPWMLFSEEKTIL